MRKGRSVSGQKEAFDNVGTDKYLTSVKRVWKHRCLMAKSKLNGVNGVSNQPTQKELKLHNYNQLLPCRHRIYTQLIYFLMAPRGPQIQPQLWTNLLCALGLYQCSWKPWLPELSNEPDPAFTALNLWPGKGNIAARVHKNRLHRDCSLTNLFTFSPP